MDFSTFAASNEIMKSIFSNRWVLLILRVFLGGVFLYAGISKMRSPQTFADSIATFELLPPFFINLVAISLPVFEIAVGLMLVVGFATEVASFSVLILTVVFAAALISALAQGLKIDCGCFGGGAPSTLKTWLALGRDLLLGGLAWFVGGRSWSKCCSD